jgi:lactoylglutathione lyase
VHVDETVPMRIEHVAIWTKDIERLRSFYQTYFQASAGPRYVNERKQFMSYFLSFASGARLEIMVKPQLVQSSDNADAPPTGYAHLALSLGSREAVDSMAERFRREGHPVVDGPRQTGDGYYECVVLDPDGNRIEITV